MLESQVFVVPRNLMQMVNASFEPVAQLRKLSLLWTDNKDKIRGFLLDDENKNFIKVNLLYAKILFLCFNYVFPFLLGKLGAQAKLRFRLLQAFPSKIKPQNFKTNFSEGGKL